VDIDDNIIDHHDDDFNDSDTPVAQNDDTAQAIDDDAPAQTEPDDSPASNEPQAANDADVDAEIDAEAEANDDESQMADTADEDPKAPTS